MKTPLSFACGTLAVLTTFCFSLGSALSQSIDPDVEVAIREEINKSTGELNASDLAKVISLDLSGEAQLRRDREPLTKLFLPDGLTKMETLKVSNNDISVSLFSPARIPEDMASLTSLDISGNIDLAPSNVLSKVDLTKLTYLNLSDTAGGAKLTLPEELTSLQTLVRWGGSRKLTEIVIPGTLVELTTLDLFGNALKDFSLPLGLTKLQLIRLESNILESFSLPGDLESLTELYLEKNELVSVELPKNLSSLEKFIIWGNYDLKDLVIPEGYSSLRQLDIEDLESLEHLTLSPGIFTDIFVDFLFNDALKTVTVPEGLLDANRRLANDIAEQDGVEIITILLPRIVTGPVFLENGNFEFHIEGPIGVYHLEHSTDMKTWTEIQAIDNTEGMITITVKPNALAPATYYRTWDELFEL